MNIEFEKAFAAEYFTKRCSERIQHELLSSSKRKRFFHRMAHTCEDYLKSDAINKKSKLLMNKSEIHEFLTRDGKNCYVIADGFEHDGGFVGCEEAIGSLWGIYSPYVLISETGKRAYIETEYNFSEHWCYFLEL